VLIQIMEIHRDEPAAWHRRCAARLRQQFPVVAATGATQGGAGATSEKQKPLVEEEGPIRSGADAGHLAAQHIDQLGQAVEARVT